MNSIISITSWTRPTDNAPMHETVEKIADGIIQRMYLNNELIQQTSSPRPYKLGQSCDGTISHCVHGLLILYCRSRKINLAKLYATAYPDEEPYTQKRQRSTLKEAKLQGITIPPKWNMPAFSGLIKSLTEINHHSLVDLLLELPPD